MRTITLFLISMLLLGCGLAAQTKIDPGAQINWTRDVSSQIHGVTNGTAAQDVVTYSQTFDNIYNVRTYGAVGDGTTDDATAIRAAMNAAPPGGIVLFPPKYVYKVNSAIDPTDWSHKIIMGYGATIKLGADITVFNITKTNVSLSGLTFLESHSNTLPAIILAGGIGGDDGHNRLSMADITIHDENIYSGPTISGHWTGIKALSHGHQSNFRNIVINNPGTGILIDPVAGDWYTDAYWSGLSISGFTTAISLVGTVAGNTFDGVRLINTISQPATGVYLNGADVNDFDGMQSWWDGARDSTYNVVSGSASSSGNTFRGGHYEGTIADFGTNVFDDVYLIELHSGAAIGGNGMFSNIGTQNHVSDGNNETAATAWTAGENALLTRSSTHKIGSYSLKVAGKSSAGNAYATQTVSKAVTGNNIVTLGAWVMAPSTNTDDAVFLFISDSVSESTISAVVPDDDQWHWVTVSFNCTGSAGNIPISLYASNVASSDDVAYFDGIQLVDGPICSSQFSPKVAGT